MLLRSSVLAIRASLAVPASRLIGAAGGGLLVCLTLLGVYLCIDLHDIAWQNARRNAATLLSVIEEGVGHNIQAYDLSLRAAARFASEPDGGALVAKLQRLAAFNAAAIGPGLGLIAVTDAKGYIVAASSTGALKTSDLSALSEFQSLRSNPGLGLILTGPSRSLMTGREIIRMTRAVGAPDGTFAGIVTGSLDLDQFQAQFSRLRFDDGLIVNVFQQDGTLLIRVPAKPGTLGRSIATSPGYRAYRASERGEFLGHSHLDGEMRLYSFANLRDLPLIVTVATSVDSIQARWIYKAAIIAALILCLNGLSVGLTILVQREFRRHAAATASTREANAALMVLARTDGLTGLPNRRSYDEHFAVEWKQATRFGTPLSLLIVDADHFKQFNDRFGHRRGDEVLRAIADCLCRTLTVGSLGFRIGGEEFVAILPGLDLTQAIGVAESVRRAVINLQIAHAPEIGGVATVSIGVASAAPDAGEGPEALFISADAALYAAKTAGRNRVRTAPQVMAVAVA
ncbi:diguanylate cyclase (GGDEF) domain-containing protein [Methylobacterium phyllostachyos]|uniref:diguanylate cyclase n=1 Tax=Methylobacterium phyllostachyos TaxID=582672 RepID=A0A1G9WUH2_9HYPH|nr:sensor domain-containing diguanylate cyclase [Methylobacterium phyllostachyos]SDM88029.1 diguanylate cyclase (GGDEF) domain-containing protein [Methylobacterium phyllostachyos]